MLSNSSRAPIRPRNPFAAVLCLLLLSFLPGSRAEKILSVPRFCASCGFSGVDSFSSQSGQFVVHGSTLPVRQPLQTNSPALISLEPQLVMITAERTKRAVCQELAMLDSFRDKVHLTVLDRAPLGQPAAIVTEMFSDGFFYKVGLPRVLEQKQFAKALVQVVLLEMANRGVNRCAELPSWLVEGMTRQALTSILPAYVVNRRPETIELAGYDRLGDSREYLQTNAPLTIQELSFPNFARFTPEERLRYEASAHFFVHRLLRLRNGPVLMARFVHLLPHTLNWQTAFFTVYQNHFDSPLKLEKWWMLNWLEFKNRQTPQFWPASLAIERLDALLLTTMEVRTSTNSLPDFRDVNLQEIIQNHDFGVQKQILSHKVQQMFFMAANVPSELMPIWNGYQRALDSYLQKRSVGEYQPALKSDPDQREQFLMKSTLKTLEELDRARTAFRAAQGQNPSGELTQASR